MACNSAAAPETSSPEPDISRAEIVESADGFLAVLEEYQSYNTRLENVAYKLQKANVDLCPRTRRSLGFTVHSVSDYPDNLQDVARILLPVSDHLSLRTVRPGSQADAAGLVAGDQIVRIGELYLPRGKTVSTFYAAASPGQLRDDEVGLVIRRDGETLEHRLSPETLCGYPVNVFFSEQVNGHTDGEEVWITSELMRIIPDDVNLALIVAHEIAHAIAGHMDLTPHKRLELQADRMGLIMMERAGYDIDQAIAYWENAPHPHSDPRIVSTHPSVQERLTHFQAVREDIRARQQSGQALDFD